MADGSTQKIRALPVHDKESKYSARNTKYSSVSSPEEPPDVTTETHHKTN